ncbi:hypothetical protein [Actinomyces sp. oral taxon 849]|uniref:hypothetical protein n=1 Tax=Actinomyces sp. oral taxon 849 TaxID=653385 RepID=UPI000677C44A|nr:hypothetical protein [Actinomyces sp. oral taxon 849]
MLQMVRVSSGVQAGAGQLVEGWSEQGAEASAGTRVGKVDGTRSHGWRVSIGSPSPAGIARSSFFFSGAVLLIACTRIAPACLVMVRVGYECSAVLTDCLLTCCILIYWSASIGSIARSFAWQDDSSLLIDEWVH